MKKLQKRLPLISLWLFVAVVPILGNGGDRIIVKPSAVLRTEPSVDSAPILQLPFGTHIKHLETTSGEVTILGVSGEWWKVRAEGREGYIFSPLLGSMDDKPKKVPKGVLVDSDFELQTKPELIAGFPAPALNCSSFEEYLLSTFEPAAPETGEREMSKMLSIRNRKFERSIAWESGWQSEYHWQTLELPLEAKEAVRSIINRCTPFRIQTPLKPPLELQFCMERSHHDISIKVHNDRILLQYSINGGGGCLTTN